MMISFWQKGLARPICLFFFLFHRMAWRILFKRAPTPNLSAHHILAILIFLSDLFPQSRGIAKHFSNLHKVAHLAHSKIKYYVRIEADIWFIFPPYPPTHTHTHTHTERKRKDILKSVVPSGLLPSMYNKTGYVPSQVFRAAMIFHIFFYFFFFLGGGVSPLYFAIRTEVTLLLFFFFPVIFFCFVF